MKRRASHREQFVVLVLAVLGWALSAPSTPAKAAETPPNILFIQTDSMDGRVMGCVGHPAMSRATPNIDALARRGVLFRNAYTNNPICCPARASMWSGWYTHHCEGWNNYKGLEPGTPTFRDQLDAAGYRTQTFGKTDYVSGQHSVRARVSAWTRSANIERPQYRCGAPKIIDQEAIRVHASDWRIADQAVKWLRDNGRSNKPFWLYLGFGLPHPEFKSSQTYAKMIDEAGITIPPADQYDHPVMRYQRVVKNWEHGFSEEMVRTVRKTYFAMIAEADAIVGQVLAGLEECGMTDSTYIVFTSDHGENAMEHRQWYKMNHYESSARIPLIVAGPGVRHGVQVDKPVSLIDMYPLLMDMAGCPIPAGLDGHSLLPDLVGCPSDRPDWVLGEYHDTTCNAGSFMLRRGDWKYIAYPGYEPMLFNLKQDPDEVQNLARSRPEQVKQLDDFLRTIVNYEAVDAKVKAYDRASFRQWRAETKAKGQYEKTMAAIFSGNEGVTPKNMVPWTDRDEALIENWLEAK